MQRLDAADALPGAVEFRARTYELLRLEPGSSVIDVGCGSGRAVSEVWRVLVPGGRVVLAGHDWEALVIDSSYPALTREIAGWWRWLFGWGRDGLSLCHSSWLVGWFEVR